MYSSGNDDFECPRCDQLENLTLQRRQLGQYDLLMRLGGGAYEPYMDHDGLPQYRTVPGC